MIGYSAGQVLRLASTLVLARILAPQAFGLVALVNVFLSGLQMLSDLGIGMDVVQHARGDEPAFVNTAFLIQGGRGIFLWFIAASLAYPFAHFYHQSAVLMLLLVGALAVPIGGFTSGSLWGLLRRVDLSTYNALTVGSDLFGFIVSLCWALVSPTAWALVLGRVAAAACLVVTSHWIADMPVSTKWDSAAAKDIFAFGSGILVSTATGFLAGESERLVVAKFVTLSQLGCFSIALSVSWAGTKGLQQIISQVFFPMMSVSVRESLEIAVRHYRKSHRLLLIVCCVASIGFISCSRLFVSIVLGPKYADAAWMLQLMGVRGAIELFMSAALSFLFALGTTRYASVGSICKLIFLAVGLTLAFTRYGLHVALWVLMLAPLMNYLPLIVGLGRRCKAILQIEVADCFKFAGVTGTAAVLYALATHHWRP
jgi:O-antigen/teichoic acid export membrane protein